MIKLSPPGKPRSAMIQVARLVATAVLGLLLVSGFVPGRPWPGVPISRGGSVVVPVGGLELAIPLGIVCLLPVAVAILLLVLSRAGRTLLRQIAESRTHLMVSALAVLLFGFTLVPLSPDGRSTAVYLALGSTALMLLLAAGSPVLTPYVELLRPAGRFLLHRLKPVHFLLFASGAVLAAANLISWRVFQHIPHVEDSIDQVFQGRIFASGRITLPVGLNDYFFSFTQIINDGAKMYAQYPFGHSLLLALGTLVHAEWLINPLLGSAEIIVLYFLGKEAYDETTGRIAALLGVASPFLPFMSSEYMNHASGLLFLSLFLLFFLRTIRPLRGSERSLVPSPSSVVPSPGIADPLLSGLSLAMALNIRPLSALAISVPAACYGVSLLFKSRWKTLPSFLVLLAPVLLGLGAFLLYNYLTTGSPLLSGYKAYGMLEYGHTRWGLGFGECGLPGWGAHTPLRGLAQTGDNLQALNLYLFESPFPGLLLVLLLFLAFTRNPLDWLLLASFASLPVVYFFYWWHDLCFGPRFLYEGLAPILLLSARGLVEYPRFLGRALGADAETRARNVLVIAAAFSLATAAMVGMPRLLMRYGLRSYGVDDRVHARVKEGQVNNAVVFIDPVFYYPGRSSNFYYGAGFQFNKLDFAGPVIYARGRGTENYVLMHRFPNRAYYYANPDTFFRITDIDSFRNAPEMRDLEQAGQFVRQRGTSGYRCVLLPYREAVTFVDSGAARLRTFREVNYDILRSHSTLTDFLPAIAVFMPSDSRKYLPVFEPMRERRDYVSDGCRFTLLFSADSGRAVVYVIRPVEADNENSRP
jgi:hypothetical protein